MNGQAATGEPAGKSSSRQTWRWLTSYGQAGIDRFSTEWNDLAHRGSLSPTADAIWMRCFWRALGESDERLVLHSLYDGDQLVAILPLRQTGRLVHAWSAIASAYHTPYWLFPLDESRPGAGVEIINHLLESADLLDFGPLHMRGPLCRVLADGARESSLNLSLIETEADVVIDLAGPWESFCRTLSKKLRKEIEQKHRKLEGLGNLAFDVVRGGDDLDQVLGECFALEALGWKGERGMPIKFTPSVLRFYTELAYAAAAAKRLALYTLRLNSRLIAFEYCLKAQGKINQLKISFHPELSKYSPGHVLMFWILRKEIEEGCIGSYHLGPPFEWKLRWATRVEPLGRLRIYGRNRMSLLAYYAGPQLRAFLKRNRALRAAVNWARERMER